MLRTSQDKMWKSIDEAESDSCNRRLARSPISSELRDCEVLRLEDRLSASIAYVEAQLLLILSPAQGENISRAFNGPVSHRRTLD